MSPETEVSRAGRRWIARLEHAAVPGAAAFDLEPTGRGRRASELTAAIRVEVPGREPQTVVPRSALKIICRLAHDGFILTDWAIEVPAGAPVSRTTGRP